ncbi:hypothetical protein KUTeg_000937 [Tegillarca granosa]|uniref:Uncharacterized protein n=1 Tax=Tegillarca granosa TaxID=220873 RepID=A0ABQ9G0M4_TEGGR|nr:hypothetical protein KUTeg_000937 [Tegillarca granosa]
MSVRTNKTSKDGIEGSLILLHREAKCLPTQVKLICEGKLKCVQRKLTFKLCKKIHSLFNAYENGEVYTSQFLKQCGRIYAPMT